MRGFTSVVRLPLFLIVVFTISAAAQEQPENNQFNGLDYTLQKPAKNERYAKKKFGDHLFISGEAGLILDRSAGSLFAKLLAFEQFVGLSACKHRTAFPIFRRVWVCMRLFGFTF